MLLKRGLIIGFGLLFLFPGFNSKKDKAHACPVVTIPREVTFQDGWHDNWESVIVAGSASPKTAHPVEPGEPLNHCSLIIYLHPYW